VVVVVTTTVVDLDVLERIGTALADRVRRLILVRLLDGAAYPAELADELGESRSNISNHLSCLRGCGLVTTVREGRNVRYQIAHRTMASALRNLGTLLLVVEANHPDLDGRR
jgi:ArsR family transcriptional regulator, cadmium/lead-responsive transcriptional repressor